MNHIKRYSFILIFFASLFLFSNNILANYTATVMNPTNASCSLYTGSTGYCFYKDSNLNSYVANVYYLDTGDVVTVYSNEPKVESKNKNLCSDYYVLTGYYSSRWNTTYRGYYCNANLRTSVLTDELKQEFTDAGFPESYFEKLAILKEAHPNWEFRAIKTNLDWNNVIAAESSVGQSLINGPEGYRSTLGGSYNYYTDTFRVLEGSKYYAASSDVVAYYMDPRNFLKDMYIFQFESLETNPTLQTIEGIKAILKNNFLYNNSGDFILAAEKSGVSSIYLAALAVQEVGNGTIATSGEGFVYNPNNKKYAKLGGTYIEGSYYNVYNIGAGTDVSPAQNSVIYARGGADKNETSFDRPWDTLTKAIVGGAKFIGDRYITKGQYTIYFKKFNVASTVWPLFSHEYQTNVTAPSSEGMKVYRTYYDLGIIDSNFVFSIPVYNNMPDSTSLPDPGNPNNYLKTLKVDNESVEGFDGEKTNYVFYVGNAKSEVTISGTTVNSKATIKNAGKKNLNVGENKFQIVVVAENKSEKTYNLSIVRSENTTGEPTITEIIDNSGIKSDGTYFSGLKLDTNTTTLVDKIKSLNANAQVQIVDSNDKPKSNTILATGDKITITSAGETKTYRVVIYGDTSGNGKIDPLDLLKVQKHILGINELSGPYAKAADVSKNSNVDPLDLLKIQKHILGVSSIEQ